MFIKILILLSNTRQGPFSVTGIHVWKLQDIQNGKWYKTNPDKGWPFFSLYLPRSFCPPVVWGFFLFIWLCSVSVVVHWISDLRWCIRDLCSTGDLGPWPGIEPGSPVLGAWSLCHWTTREVLSPPGLNHINFHTLLSWGHFFVQIKQIKCNSVIKINNTTI